LRRSPRPSLRSDDAGVTALAHPLGKTQQARVAIPFLIVTLIWSSTWIVIRDQLGVVPPVWSVSYRFAAAGIGMVVLALIRGDSFRIGKAGQGIALVFGLFQVVLNFNLVYRAEAYVTSGLVAVTFALLIVPNALLGRIVLAQGVTPRFLAGSAVALVGVGLLFAHEVAVAPAGGHAVAIGLGLTLLGVLSASVSNVLQGSAVARTLPMPTVLAWGMLWGTAMNSLLGLATVGLPVGDARVIYWVEVLYLGLVASALAFTLYFGMIRAIGPARAGYVNVLTPILAMAISTMFEGYRWSLLAGAGAVLAFAGLLIALQARGR
jgi:drug/metabolite transporter (DMT)-like permease